MYSVLFHVNTNLKSRTLIYNHKVTSLNTNRLPHSKVICFQVLKLYIIQVNYKCSIFGHSQHGTYSGKILTSIDKIHRSIFAIDMVCAAIYRSIGILAPVNQSTSGCGLINGWAMCVECIQRFATSLQCQSTERRAHAPWGWHWFALLALYLSPFPTWEPGTYYV